MQNSVGDSKVEFENRTNSKMNCYKLKWSWISSICHCWTMEM